MRTVLILDGGAGLIGLALKRRCRPSAQVEDVGRALEDIELDFDGRQLFPSDSQGPLRFGELLRNPGELFFTEPQTIDFCTGLFQELDVTFQLGLVILGLPGQLGGLLLRGLGCALQFLDFVTQRRMALRGHETKTRRKIQQHLFTRVPADGRVYSTDLRALTATPRDV